jgi:hypothetical protein
VPGPFRLLSRRMGPVGVALTAYDIWRRIPKRQRRQLMNVARKHGPRAAAAVARRTRAARRR